MKYRLAEHPVLEDTPCLVLGLFDNQPLPEFADALDQHFGGVLQRLATQLKEPGDWLWQAELTPGHGVLLIQCGAKNTFTHEQLEKRLTDITSTLLKHRLTDATLCLPAVAGKTPDWQIQHMVLKADAIHYQLLDYKSKKNKPHALQSLAFYLPGAQQSDLEAAQIIAQSVRLTRTLANLPANVCTPTYMAEQAQALAKQYPSIEVKIMGPDRMRDMGMGALLAVAQGSKEPPQLIEIQYKGSEKKPPIALVGKGITFDSGGLSLKPADAMHEMKYDMAGAASVLGAIQACAKLQLPIHVIGILACSENLPGGTAIKPGDIVTGMSGQTIEIINTDAEGRLVLSDALTYVEQFNPDWVIDIATLTGAMVIALGSVATGFMTQDDALATLITQAASDSGDKAWRMPLDDAYQAAIDSPLADVLNATFDRTAGSITAACFLSRFTGKYRWAHMDIAGTAWVSGRNRDATGRPVPLLIELLRKAAHAR